MTAYQVALDTRKFEIGLFWQRSNYFLVLNTGVAVGYFSQDKSSFSALVLSLLGIGGAYLWLLINFGSKFWQIRWERRLELAEADLGGGLQLFSAGWPLIIEDVKKSLAKRYPARRFYGRWIANLYDRAVLRKPSVSKVMTALSLLFLCFWLAATLVSGISVVTDDGNGDREPHRAREVRS